MGMLKTAIKYAIPLVIGFYIGSCDKEIAMEREYNLVPKSIETRIDAPKLDGLEMVLEKYNGGR